MDYFAPEYNLQRTLSHSERALTFHPDRDFNSWRKQVKRTFTRLLGAFPEITAPNIRILGDEVKADYREIRYVFTAEPMADVPCHLLLPRLSRPPFPVVVCLQGHLPGMYISLGKIKSEADADKARLHNYAEQAVEQGYAALAVELRAFGEREERKTMKNPRGVCYLPSLAALLLGRTMAGQRVWDVMRALDTLEQFPEVDTRRIGCMGFSGGGVIAYYAACLDKRIRIAMPICSFATYAKSIFSISHCACNYIPGILEYLELGDLAAMIAPRGLVVLSATQDTVFPIAAAEEAFATVQRIYELEGAPDHCRLVACPGGHDFYPDQAWDSFRDMCDRMKCGNG